MRNSVYNLVDDFICKSFKWANAADPDAQLFYNDFNHGPAASRYKAKSDAVYELVKELKEKDCPIHGVGFQMHIQNDFSDEMVEGFRSNI